ncbi:cobalamin biosynthesis protein [Nocardia cerradoensis]|uniref:cobalamin biosynthesis protein n=1 Tax=Nocardia cerradoensis TaxID=85688 RepID=UPI0002FE4F0A|nr:cobalamin biosynthesis protein [Nocardia cerradoensis]NKY44400.1 cobalamin biosynthesis protein [Nocardia cerradoensis]
MRYGTARAAGLLIGFAADRIFGDPRRGHPVALFGSAAAALESPWYRDTRAAGVVHEIVLVGGVVALGAGAEIAGRRSGALRGRRAVASAGADRRKGGGAAGRTRDGCTDPRTAAGRSGLRAGLGTVVITAVGTWIALGGTTLARTGRDMADRLEAGELSGARELLPSLCGRDPEVLDADGLARAAVESIAENTSDATVAPLVWGAIAGVPGVLGYRAINTLDAMIGYRNERYRNFGWAAARVDDLANLLPARVSGALTVALAPLVGGRPGDAWRAWRRDAGAHPSPNAGVAEATMAGALGVALGGRTEYRHGIEMRPVLGSGRTPQVPDLRRAVRLSNGVQLAAAVAAAAYALGRRRSVRAELPE